MRRIIGTLVYIGCILAPCGMSQPLRRVLIPEQDGLERVRPYVNALRSLTSINKDYFANWAKAHNGPYSETDLSDACPHKNAPFLVWHHTYLVLTEELLAKALNQEQFAMPFWSPAQSRYLPSVFDCVSPECKELSVPKRLQSFPSGSSEYNDFTKAYDAWQKLSACKDRSFFCLSACDGDAIRSLGGTSIADGNQLRAGLLETLVHDPVHDAGCPANTENNLSLCSHIGEATRAALDPLFHPFHAGIDAAFVSLLSRPNIRCEICSQRFAAEKGDTYGLEWMNKEYPLPEPGCLTRGTLSFDSNAEYAPGKKCSGEKIKQLYGIPFREFSIREMLTDERFWRIGYLDATSGSVFGTGAPCPLKYEDLKCTDSSGEFFPCPESGRVKSILLSRKFLWLRGDRFRGEEGAFEESIFRVRVENMDAESLVNRVYHVVLKSGRRSVPVGSVRLTPWELSLRNRHHHAASQQVEFSLLPDKATRAAIAAMLKSKQRIFAEIADDNGSVVNAPKGTRKVVLDIVPRKLKN
jgi:hypothetical protein